MKAALTLLFCLLAAPLLLSCAMGTSAGSDLCSGSEPRTELQVGHYSVGVLRPNEPTNPDIWEGPICIRNNANNSGCSADVSLIKRIKYEPESRRLSVTVFSGSNADLVEIDMDTCDVVGKKAASGRLVTDELN